MLVVGSIHGDEEAGIEVAEHVRDAAAIPNGFDVWVMPTINPDGNVLDFHTNVKGVDLNRNFVELHDELGARRLRLRCPATAPASSPCSGEPWDLTPSPTS